MKTEIQVIVYQNKFNNWEARTTEKNPTILVGPTMTGFASKEYLLEVVSELMPGCPVIEAEY